MKFFRAVALGAVLASVGCWNTSPAVKPQLLKLATAETPLKYKDHNLVFISIDALQAAHVGCLGNPRPGVTPALDAFASQSFNFTQTCSVASWTVPASMTWFTGVYPSEHRMTNKFAVYRPDWQKPAKLKELSPELITLAEILKRQGYATGGFTGNAGVSGGFGYEQGFDVYFYEKDKFGGFDQSVPRAVEWLRKNRGQKFFLFLHGYDAHGQHLPAKGLDYRFVDRGYDGKYTGAVQEQERLREEGLEYGRVSLRDSDVRFWRAIYDEKIQRADEKLQTFLAEFDKLGLGGRTLFIVTSDHGTEFYEHGRLDHGFTLYDEQIHVPLFIRLPDRAAGGALTRRVSSIDVLPTLLDLLDIEPPEQLRGRSLADAMRGEGEGRDVFSETDYREYTFKRSIITPDGWKLIYTLESKSRELYYLPDDRGETRDRSADEIAQAEELTRRLFAHFTAIGCDLQSRRWERGLNPVYRSQGEPKPGN